MRGHMKLVHALIAKSIAETILVGGLAVAFFIHAFPPTYHGWAEVQPRGFAGWAVNHSNQFERLEVQLFIDGKFVARTIADQSRPDVVAAGWARDEWHGYRFEVLSLPGPGLHQARVYALHSVRQGAFQTLQTVGDPVGFDIDTDGVFHPLSGNSVKTETPR
jgi:hypothetical protein